MNPEELKLNCYYVRLDTGYKKYDILKYLGKRFVTPPFIFRFKTLEGWVHMSELGLLTIIKEISYEEAMAEIL